MNREHTPHAIGGWEVDFPAFGQTDAGRYLTVFFVRKEDGRALILSARNMTRAERRIYEQK